MLQQGYSTIIPKSTFSIEACLCIAAAAAIITATAAAATVAAAAVVFDELIGRGLGYFAAGVAIRITKPRVFNVLFSSNINYFGSAKLQSIEKEKEKEYCSHFLLVMNARVATVASTTRVARTATVATTPALMVLSPLRVFQPEQRNNYLNF